MSRELVVTLDEFARRALESFVRNRRGSDSAAIRLASLYYLADRDTERSTWEVPAFARAGHDDGAADKDPITVTLDYETWDVLSEEAARQDVAPQTLMQHAVMYFLADVESGRVAGRLDDALASLKRS
jgi:hypothetical protein